MRGIAQARARCACPPCRTAPEGARACHAPPAPPCCGHSAPSCAAARPDRHWTAAVKNCATSGDVSPRASRFDRPPPSSALFDRRPPPPTRQFGRLASRASRPAQRLSRLTMERPISLPSAIRSRTVRHGAHGTTPVNGYERDDVDPLRAKLLRLRVHRERDARDARILRTVSVRVPIGCAIF
jgi:hypothetical protein